MNKSSIIITVLFLGAAGTIAAILLAQEEETRTRSKIMEKGQEYKDYMRNNYDHISNSVSNKYEDMEDRAERLGEQAIDKAKKAKEDAVKN